MSYVKVSHQCFNWPSPSFKVMKMFKLWLGTPVQKQIATLMSMQRKSCNLGHGGFLNLAYYWR